MRPFFSTSKSALILDLTPGFTEQVPFSQWQNSPSFIASFVSFSKVLFLASNQSDHSVVLMLNQGSQSGGSSPGQAKAVRFGQRYFGRSSGGRASSFSRRLIP